MGTIVIYAIIAMTIAGAVLALILYVVAQKFKIIEDPRIDQVVEKLPGANCGGCGFAGCRNLAEEIVKAGNLENKACPVGGDPVMKQIAGIMGIEAGESEPMIAVVRCNGGSCNTKKKVQYDGVMDCVSANQNFAGESGCAFGCLGCGTCVSACKFDALRINPETSLAEVNQDKCVGCGACVKVCPRKVIELRKKGLKDKRVFVSCVNKEKGANAKKNCDVACIGCGKCEKTCPFGAITIENNLSYIDYNKCKMCRKCVEVCPTGAIHAVNFPEKKIVVEQPQQENNSQNENKENLLKQE
ncbi:MAG: RnfABCDGE type electron transport complex subunit B [Bacteroidales bacterium]|jgi:Na+-translocating ferredoxin:NAD+ oxidoreductase RNF subunit RnfB|nr:RnfABCDGE type electron transport complex subunit B [Bacteroidales bacterium]